MCRRLITFVILMGISIGISFGDASGAADTDAAAAFFARCPECALEIVAATDELLMRFSVEQYHFVFLGKSPAPFEAELETRGILDFTRVPVTTAADQDLDGLRSWLKRRLPDPNSSSIASRKILLIDYASTGISLTLVQELAHEIYRGISPKEVEVLALETQFSRHRFYISKYGRLPYSSLRLGWSLGEEIIDKNLKKFSSTPSYQPSPAGTEPPEPVFDRTAFEEFKLALVRMKLRSGLASSIGPSTGSKSCDSLFVAYR